MSTESDLFKANLERWKLFQPKSAALVEKTPLTTVSTAYNENGIELNLFKEIDGQKIPLYSSNISEELAQWGDQLNRSSFNILFIYGIGLGYYYAFMKEWLETSPKAFIVFLEDDLEVIRAFLDTELATVFLNDPRARLYYFNPESEDDRQTFQHLGMMAVLEKRGKSALKSYKELKPRLFSECSGKLDYYCNSMSEIINEYIQFSLGFQLNFFENMFELPRAHTATKIFESFKNVPAIICGAGPSLAKNIDLLKQLQDKALIIAGGTAINALNAKQFNPHFGAGIDPNPFQYTRLIANQAFETPFFYRTRILNKALKIVHGDHLYVSGTGGHVVSDWFENKLGIESYPVEEGHNVVNLSVSLAKALGCNPIILVGVDLAYSNKENYSPGIQVHALHDRKSNLFTKNPDEELITKKDIFGEPVTTLWKWINESVWFGRFAKMNPDITVINATEGGIGFPEVTNMTLKEVADQYLTKSYDFPTLIHRSIQRSMLPETVNIEKVQSLMKNLSESLARCVNLYDQTIIAWKEHSVNLLTGESYPDDYMPSKVEELLGQLKQEDGWEALLKIYNTAYFPILYTKQKEIDFNPIFKKDTFSLSRTDFFIRSVEFLKKAAIMKSYLIEDVIDTYLAEKRLVPNQSVAPQTAKLKEELAKDHEQNDGGTVKEDKDVNGKVLSRSTFANGLRNGKSWFYFPDKSLKSLLRYKEGELDGIQEYYYPNGNLKTVLRYSNGLLDGEQILYHSNGKLYRQLYFKQGHRDGVEKLWTMSGIQIMEAHYKDGEPTGTAREWFANGNLAKEIVYNEDPALTKTRVWSVEGAVVDVEKTKKDDYFDSLTKVTSQLTKSLDQIYNSLDTVTKSANIKSNPDETTIEHDMHKMHEDLEALHRINQEMIFETGGDSKNKKEQIWKTPSAQREMESYLRDMTKKMTDDLNSIQGALSLALGLLAENPKFEKPLDVKEDDNSKKKSP